MSVTVSDFPKPAPSTSLPRVSSAANQAGERPTSRLTLRVGSSRIRLGLTCCMSSQSPGLVARYTSQKADVGIGEA